ncbi:kinase/pyrophosphorylase [Pacificimonas sp. WHA3]|uniref:Putative pyruvate, phosphate dikinase regulatory protein n=1 Tax=Pacificimonas pallii TaxID=2827236 RepID=A0ABS6SBG4_9SPHN|nr:pyruvate, water dikinase regulatory protein [Pacificimonas pallii]MBV7255755.1 kinase/pyrophosphorylase [Pacificimonas pallii]
MAARIHIHLVSDSTGETLESVARASLARFEGVDAVKHFWPLVRSKGHMDRVLDDIASNPGLVIFTLATGEVRNHLETRTEALGLPAVSAIDPVVAGLAMMLGKAATAKPGRQHKLDDAYFARVEAINYTMAHDDGQMAENWNEADILLVGVSRTSKTPTSIYLANRGYKTANYPLVPTRDPPPHMFQLKKPFIVGLTTTPQRLVEVRRNRLLSLAQAPDTTYVDNERVKAEVLNARRLFADQGWPVIDVTRKAIEETAAAVINLMNEALPSGEAGGPSPSA